MGENEKSAPEALREAVVEILATLDRDGHVDCGWDDVEVAALRAAHQRPGAYGDVDDDRLAEARSAQVAHENACAALREAGVEFDTVADGIRKLREQRRDDLVEHARHETDLLRRARKAEAAGGVGLLRRACKAARKLPGHEGPYGLAVHQADVVVMFDRLIAEAEAQPAEGIDTRGLYGKFFIARVDGRDKPGEKHAGCDYFVLDLTHDKHALPAIRAYARDCKAERPQLSADLMAKYGAAEEPEQHQGVGEEQGCPTRTQAASAEGRAPVATSPTPPSQPKREPQEGDDVLRRCVEELGMRYETEGGIPPDHCWFDAAFLVLLRRALR